ncbi:MAG: hypothetical protein M3680_05560 [Myxococcota bacterium]|nr:hypothetical protein [Myxococcota bacterium]
MSALAAALAGCLFAIGLVISGMTDPARVVGFLDLGGAWDPTLAFVMAGAVGVFATFARLIRGRAKPLLGAGFYLPTARTIDRRLVAGSALFGIGWGLSGYCPGPALVVAGTGSLEILVFLAALVAGIALARVIPRRAR